MIKRYTNLRLLYTYLLTQPGDATGNGGNISEKMRYGDVVTTDH